MDYSSNHFRDWLIKHPLIKIKVLEKSAGIPIDTLRHFKLKRRNLSKKHFDSLIPILKEYGYKPLKNK